MCYFFEDLPAEPDKTSKRLAPPKGRPKDPLLKRESLELVRAYYKIRISKVRKAIANAVLSLG